MKKHLLLVFLSLLTTVCAVAQGSSTFQFIDKSGNTVADGASLNVSQLTEDEIMGNFISTGLSVKNVSQSSAVVRISYQIETLDNGLFQLCFPSSCISKSETGSFTTTKGTMAAGEVRDLQCEWFPQAYGTCKATLALEVLNDQGTKIADGPKVHVTFQYDDPSQSGSQYLCGYYNTDELAKYGSGMGYYTSGVCKAATEFGKDIYMNYTGFKVIGMRVGLCHSVSNFGVFISKVSNQSFVDFKQKSVGSGENGWNTIMFDENEQFELPDDGTTFIVGFNYYQVAGQGSDAYPISYYEGSTQKGTFWFYGSIPGYGTRWFDLGSDGALSVQLIVEGELPDQKIVIGDINIDSYAKIGNELTGEISISNVGKNAVNSLGFNYYIDDTKVGDAPITEDIASTMTEKINLSIPVPSDLSVGQHSVKVELTSINGAAPTGEVVNNNFTVPFTAFIDSKTRQKQLIEHITSWTCTYCYHGYNILRELEKEYSDIAWVAVHGNQSAQQDPYYFPACNKIMSNLAYTGFPTAAFNRSYIPELAEETATLTYSLGYNTDQYLAEIVPYIRGFIDQTTALPSFVSLDIQSSFNATNREMQVIVKGSGASQAALLLNGYRMTIYVTEAGLKGRQYCAGSWQNNFEHNNTLRAVLTNVNGDEITWEGDNFTFTKTYTVPDSYKEENLSIVAFVAPAPGDIYNMAVNNCEKVKLNLTPTAIQTVKTSAKAEETERYILDGRQVSAPRRGVNIVRMSDGTTRKVIVK